MGCNCGKPKCDGHCGVSPAVLQINNPSECTLFHRVEVPASMGDSKTNPPKNGAYKNVLLYYEADQTSWLYSSDGIPTLVTGEQGPQGPAGTVAVGTTTTGEPGSNASVENVGTPENAILNFTIPQGPRVPEEEVQEDVNNKLDDMVEDGTFNTLLANYLVICGANAKVLGCAGDGLTDDTAAINSAIASVVTLGVNKLVFPEGEYVISGSISLPSNFELVGMKNSVLKYVGEGTDTSHPLIDCSGSENSPLSNITIDNITIDCTGQVYKGGSSLDDPDTTCPTPVSQGLRGIYLSYVINSTIKNCKIIDLYGDGIRIERSHTINVEKNILNDCGGGNIVSGGSTGYDNFGDGIVAFFCWDIKISDNTLVNTRTYLSDTANGYICGRSGIEYEYGLTDDGHDTPDQGLFVDKSGNGLVMTNNYIYGYTKGIHLEAGVKCIISNNTVIHNNIGMMNSIGGKTVISDNYFNQDEVGPAYQGGYNLYYCGVAVSQYVAGYPESGCVTISDNIFDGDSNGVVIGRSYVNVTSNTFRGNGTSPDGAVYNNIADLHSINISANAFYDCTVHLYHTRGVTVSNNIFDNENNRCIRIEECDHTIIDSNIFDNYVSATSNCYNSVISNNSFKIREDANYTTMINLVSTMRNACIEGNLFDLTQDDDILGITIQSSVNSRIINNLFKVADTRTTKAIYINGGATNISVEYNEFLGCGYKGSLIETNWDISGLSLVGNTCDVPSCYIFKQTSGSCSGGTHITHNIGNMDLTNAINTPGRFTNRFMQLGDILNSSMKINNAYAYYVSQGGYYVTDNWTNGTSYAVNKLVKHNGYVYKCLVAGTASVAPSNTTFGEEETGGDGVKWVCMSKAATLDNITV